MKKILINKQEKLMCFEDVLEYFSNYIDRQVEIFCNDNVFLNTDEVKQEFLISLWESYNKYDSNKKTDFSLYYYYRLLTKKRDILYNANDSIDAKVHKNYVDVDDYDIIDSNITLENKIIAKHILNNLYNNFDNDLVNVLIDKNNFPVSEYADKHQLTRAGVYLRLDKLKKEVRTFINE